MVGAARERLRLWRSVCVMRLRGGNHEHTATLRRPVALHPRSPTHQGVCGTAGPIALVGSGAPRSLARSCGCAWVAPGRYGRFVDWNRLGNTTTRTVSVSRDEREGFPVGGNAWMWAMTSPTDRLGC